MAKKIITIGKKGIRERVEGSGPVDSYSFDNLQAMSPYTVGELPEDRFKTIQEAIDQWDADGQPPFPIYIRPKKLTGDNVFTSAPIDASHYAENIILPRQIEGKSNPLQLIGLQQESDLLIDYATLWAQSRPIINGSITAPETTSFNLGMSNLSLFSWTKNAISIPSGGTADSRLMYLDLANVYLYGVPYAFDQGNQRFKIKLNKCSINSTQGVFAPRNVAANIANGNSNVIQADNSYLQYLKCTGSGHKPAMELRNCNIGGQVILEGDRHPVDHMFFDNCFFQMRSSLSVPDGESAIRISATEDENPNRFKDCIFDLRRASGANCNIFDFNADTYLDVLISMNSAGTGDFAISSDGNAYELYANVKAYPPYGIPTTTTDGNVTVVNPSVNLT